MWVYKTNRWGEATPAVKRRESICELDLDSHESRSKFGYCYLEYFNGKS